MNGRLNKIIIDKSSEFSNWFEILNRHRDSILAVEVPSQKEYSQLTFETSSVLGEIADLAIKYGGFKDNFDTSKMYMNLYGPSLIIKSVKTGGIFYLATDLEGIHLETSFLHDDNLKNMNDQFWVELFELKKFRGFEYKENSHFNIDTQRKYPELFHTYKDTLFLMFRKFFLSHMENHNEIDIGSFKVKWELNEDFSETIEGICLAFKSMYRMNHKLWKVTDLRKKKKANDSLT